MMVAADKKIIFSAFVFVFRRELSITQIPLCEMPSDNLNFQCALITGGGARCNLTLQLLPHFRLKPAAMIINISSVLGFVLFSIINPVYNGTKAWLHFWSLNLGTQLRDPQAKIKVVEIAPPMVGTDLHRDREDPDDNKKETNAISLSVEEFMKEVAEKMERGEEMITAGPMGREIVGAWYGNDELGARYKKVEEGGI